MVISSLSTEYVRIRIVAEKNGAFIDPTPDTVQFSFPATGNPTTWSAGSWETDTDTLGNKVYYARCLVGPLGTVTLTAGKYDVWVKITDNPEIPVINAGRLTVV